MKEINRKKIYKITGDYTEELLKHLRNKNAARDHLQAALDAYQEDQNKEALLLAMRDVAEAQGGIGHLAKTTKLNREHLYHLLSGKGNPRLDTLSLILKSFGFHLKIAIKKKAA